MKSYNIDNYIRYKKDVEASQPESKQWSEYTRDELIVKFLPLVENIAKKFSTAQQASGVLDITDLIQFGSIGLIQAIEHKIFPISAVQFHPESILTDVGEQLVTNFINANS